MGDRLGNRQIDLSNKKQMTQIACGKTGDVYRYRNEALKVFRDDIQVPMDLKTAEYLTRISTERILLPRNLLFHNNAFKGYSMKLVPKKGSSKRIITTPTPAFLEEVEVVEEDITHLSRKRVLLSGVSPDNSFFNGNLFLTDPQKYTVLDTDRFEQLEQINNYQFQLLLIELITKELNKGNYPQAAINRLKELLSLKDLDTKMSEYLRDLTAGQADLKQLVKKIG